MIIICVPQTKRPNDSIEKRQWSICRTEKMQKPAIYGDCPQKNFKPKKIILEFYDDDESLGIFHEVRDGRIPSPKFRPALRIPELSERTLISLCTEKWTLFGQ